MVFADHTDQKARRHSSYKTRPCLQNLQVMAVTAIMSTRRGDRRSDQQPARRVRSRSASLVLAAVMLTGAVSQVTAENWPQWRGALRNGVSGEKNVPLRWTKTENITWKVDLPAWSGSTPIVW